MTLIEVSISAALVSLVFYGALSGYVSSMKGSAAGITRLESMANGARAMVGMNLELQEASVRDETVEIYLIDPDTGQLADDPIDSASVPPPGTVYPTSNSVGDNSYALRFMTVGGFTIEADSIELDEDGPFLFRLGYGAPADYPRTYLLREEQGSPEAPRILCRGVEQIIFQRDARGGAILITLMTSSRDHINGQELISRQVLTVTPKNDFSANLANFDMSGEEM